MSTYASVFSILNTTSQFEGTRRRLTVKLREMAKLPGGWSYGEGAQVSMNAILTAEAFVLLASDLELKADVFPNLDGGCAVVFYQGEDSVEVSISEDGGQLNMRVERGIGFQFEELVPPTENVSFDTILSQVVQLIQDDKWKLPASFTSEISTQLINAFVMCAYDTLPGQPTPQPLQTVGGGSQSSILLVPAPVV